MSILLKKVTRIAGVDVPGGVLVLGLTPDVSAFLAQGGDAESVPVDAGVPLIVKISEAALAGAPGTDGVVYELSDGPNRGARVIWATPEGSITPTWCWWLWPQSPYEGA